MPLSPSSNLRNSITFPSFAGLPGENDIDLCYYSENPQTGVYRPNRHWAFLAEIVDFSTFIRLQIRVKDKSGQVLPVWIHTDDRGRDLARQCQQGYTIVFTYAEMHYFADGTVGIRLEEGAYVKVLPYSLAELMAANDIVFEEDRKGKCSFCGTMQGDISDNLKVCSRCKNTFYCGRECQAKAWAKSHKKDCKIITEIEWFTDKDWEKFEGWWNRRIPQPRPPRPIIMAYTMGHSGEVEPVNF